jgi:tetratricopeptide (TPR) repeat protein
MEVGEFDRAAEALARVVEGRPLPNTRAGLAVALAEQGRCDEARWQLDALLAGDPRTPTPRELELTGATLSAWASAQANHRPAAEHWLAQLAPHGRAYAFSVFSFTGFVGHHVGALLATLGRAEEAIPLLEEAVERYRRDDAPVWEARACRDLARALGSRGADGDRARISELRARAPGGAV